MNPDEAMAVLKQYLRTLALQKHPLDADGRPAPVDGSYSHDDSPAADVARAWCRELLAEANADGLGGCRLCCS